MFVLLFFRRNSWKKAGYFSKKGKFGWTFYLYLWCKIMPDMNYLYGYNLKQ